jgi:hypothetical protein
MCGLVAYAQSEEPRMSDFPAPGADDVAIVIQLKDYYNLDLSEQRDQAVADLKALFGDRDIVYVPKLHLFSIMIGRTDLAEMNPIYIETKKKYPNAPIRRMSIKQVNKMCDQLN